MGAATSGLLDPSVSGQGIAIDVECSFIVTKAVLAPAKSAYHKLDATQQGQIEALSNEF
jgi:hypothetical protein